jgi:teichuronic acid biosynthesis glycosyltransferase TuaC
MPESSVTASPGRLRVLVVTKLFPNEAEPTMAMYNRLQCVALSRLCDVDVRAVIPWFPGASVLGRWSSAGRCASVPAQENVDGLTVRHPRFLFVPKLGAAFAPELYLASLWPGLRALKGKVDVVLGCWAFPDGVAAIRLARMLGAASVVKVHGSDLNVLARQEPYRRILTRTLPRVGRLVAVSRPLAERAVELGVPADRVEVVRNGLDREVFRIRDRAAMRSDLGIAQEARWILYVGGLHLTKGVGDLLDAFDRLAPEHPDLRLALVGAGPEAARVRQAVERHPGRVVMAGALPAEGVARWMGACDVVTLPSWNEGTPNVLLEAFASGRRVVATRVGGIPDVVDSPDLGTLVDAKDVPALADALAQAAGQGGDPEVLRAAAPYGWPESAARLLGVLSDAAREARAAATARLDRPR